MLARLTAGWDPELKPKIALAFAAIYLIFGGTYLGISIMVHGHIPPISGNGARYGIAGLFVIVGMRLRGSTVALDRSSMFATATLGALLLAPFGLIGLAERHIASGLAALVVASVPIIVVALRVAVDRERVPLAVWLGVLVGFPGVALLVVAGGGETEAAVWATALTLLAAFAVALGTFLVPRMSVSVSPLVSAGWQLVWAGVLLLIVGLASGEALDFQLDAVTFDGALAFALLVLIGSVPPYASYIWLLTQVPVSQVATSTYVNPLVAVFLGWLVVDEEIGLATVVGGALILVSVVLVVSREASPG